MFSCAFAVSVSSVCPSSSYFFFFNDPAPPEFSPLPLPDPLPIPASRESLEVDPRRSEPGLRARQREPAPRARGRGAGRVRADGGDRFPLLRRLAPPRPRRSEEHTSELQSRLHLVCRLLLEKKKKN